MPSLSQLYATSGRRSPLRIEDLNRSSLSSLYAGRAQAIENQQLDIAQQGLDVRKQEMGLRQEESALRSREADLAASQTNTALLTQGVGTGIAGAGLLEAAYPGTLRGLGTKVGGLFTSGGGEATASEAASGAATASGLSAATTGGGLRAVSVEALRVRLRAHGAIVDLP